MKRAGSATALADVVPLRPDVRVPFADEEWSRFYAEHFPLVWRVLTRFGAPPHEVEDLAQDVFVIAHRKLPSFRGEASVRTWLFAICRRVAWHSRRRNATRAAFLTLLGGGRQVCVPADSVRRDLEVLLARLSEPKRMTVLLHEVDGMSCAEIAELWGCPEATVWSRLRLAWADLRKLADESE